MENKGFVSLEELDGKISNKEIMGTYEDLRNAFEETFTNFVDASDAYALIEFPFAKGADVPDDCKVRWWETGYLLGQPALRSKSDILVLSQNDSKLLPITSIGIEVGDC